MTDLFNLWHQNKDKLAKKLGKGFFAGVNSKVMYDSVTRLNPFYLAKYNPVMFAVEVGFFLVLFIAFFPNLSTEFINEN
jgi:high-affinity K+ transport system ATPase subunit B